MGIFDRFFNSASRQADEAMKVAEAISLNLWRPLVQGEADFPAEATKAYRGFGPGGRRVVIAKSGRGGEMQYSLALDGQLAVSCTYAPSEHVNSHPRIQGDVRLYKLIHRIEEELLQRELQAGIPQED